MNIEELRVTKLKEYLLRVINDIATSRNFNIDALPKDTGTYSLDKIPTESTVEKWTIGMEIHRDIFMLRSNRNYSYETINNLKNIGFFEIFEQKIFENNSDGILPDIEGIEKIECLDCGAIKSVETNTAEFGIQIQITYRIKPKSKDFAL